MLYQEQTGKATPAAASDMRLIQLEPINIKVERRSLSVLKGDGPLYNGKGTSLRSIVTLNGKTRDGFGAQGDP